MSGLIIPLERDAPDVAIVTSRTRRYVLLLDRGGCELNGRATTETEDVTVGDYVRFTREDDQIRVTEILPRKSFLSRSYGKATRRIAANVDELFIVTAPVPLFNTSFIDRILVAAFWQNIPCSLVVNKVDLNLEKTESLLNVYEQLSVPVLYTSAQSGEGVQELLQRLSEPELHIITLAGISGVGKSTLLNQLIPGTDRRTGEVSRRTGQGTQTTTQSMAYQYEREDICDLFIIDLPGIQNFGITDYTPSEIEKTFTEFTPHKSNCEYHNCMHLAEPICGVKSAIESGIIADSRYESYCSILDEVERFREY